MNSIYGFSEQSLTAKRPNEKNHGKNWKAQYTFNPWWTRH